MECLMFIRRVKTERPRFPTSFSTCSQSESTSSTRGSPSAPAKSVAPAVAAAAHAVHGPGPRLATGSRRLRVHRIRVVQPERPRRARPREAGPVRRGAVLRAADGADVDGQRLRAYGAPVVQHSSPPFRRVGRGGVLVDVHVRLTGHGHPSRRHHVPVHLIFQELLDRHTAARRVAATRPACHRLSLLLHVNMRSVNRHGPATGQRKRAAPHPADGPLLVYRSSRWHVVRVASIARRVALRRHAARVAPIALRVALWRDVTRTTPVLRRTADGSREPCRRGPGTAGYGQSRVGVKLHRAILPFGLRGNGHRYFGIRRSR